MKFPLGLFLLAVLSTSTSLSVFAQPTPAPTFAPQQQRQIKEVKHANAEFFRAIGEKDIVTIDERIADEGILCDSGRLQTTSKLAFEKALQSPSFKAMLVTVNESTVQLQGQTVVVLSSVSIQDPAVSQMPTTRVNIMNVFIKRDGRWQVLVSHSANQMSPSPPK